MVVYAFSKEKDKLVKRKHGISFEEVIKAIDGKKILAKFAHPNKRKYPNQFIFVIDVQGYAIVVPYVEQDEAIFLKTAFPSRKYTKKFLKVKRKEKYEKKV